VLKDLRISYEKPVLFLEYHYKLNSLAFDIGLLPFVNNSYNVSGKSLNRFLDFSVNMVPVVAQNMLPLSKIIKDGENGFIAFTEEE